jgi:hypothetical protein
MMMDINAIEGRTIFRVGGMSVTSFFVLTITFSLYVTSALGHKSPAGQAAFMVALVFFAQISFVIVQMQINTLMERQRSTRPT